MTLSKYDPTHESAARIAKVRVALGLISALAYATCRLEANYAQVLNVPKLFCMMQDKVKLVPAGACASVRCCAMLRLALQCWL